MKVSVHSITPSVDVASPTPDVRVRRTPEHAVVEHQDSEVRPDRDLEVASRLAPPAPITVVPNRRGDDGDFMLLLTSPDPTAGAGRRELLPESDPLERVIVADTSASMGRAQRAAPAAFIESRLSFLGEKERFRLLAADVSVHPFREEPAPAREEDVPAAVAFLEERFEPLAPAASAPGGAQAGTGDTGHVASGVCARAPARLSLRPHEGGRLDRDDAVTMGRGQGEGGSR